MYFVQSERVELSRSFERYHLKVVRLPFRHDCVELAFHLHQLLHHLLLFVPAQGFEPRYKEPKSSVLPLDDAGVRTVGIEPTSLSAQGFEACAFAFRHARKNTRCVRLPTLNSPNATLRLGLKAQEQ